MTVGATLPSDRPAEVPLFDQLPDGVGILEPNGRLVYVNPAACRMLRRDAEELVGANLRQFLEDEEASLLLTVIQRVATTGRAERFEHFHRPRQRWYLND